LKKIVELSVESESDLTKYNDFERYALKKMNKKILGLENII